MPGMMSHRMNQEATAAEIQDIDKDSNEQLGPKGPVPCRYEPNGKKLRNADGQVVDQRDRLLTHTALDTGYMVWPPGADTSTTEEAQRPSEVNAVPSLDNSDTLYEVVL